MSGSPSKDNDLFPLFLKENYIDFDCDINGLRKRLRLKHDSTEWMLQAWFESCNASQWHPTCSVGHAAHMKETYANMTALLDSLEYAQLKWKITGNLRVIDAIFGMQ